MKKIYCGLVLLSITYAAQGMLLRRAACSRRIITRPKVRVLAQKRAFSTQSTIKISEKCYQNWQNISEDAAKLKYYMQGVCNSMGKAGRADVRPSAILQFLRYKSDIDNATQLKYMPATGYMNFFITDQNYTDFDNAFSQKYTETQNLQETWNWFHGHFVQHMKTAIEDYGKDIMERDAAKVTLEEQGVYFKDNGRIIVFDGNRISEDPKDMKAVREALDRIYKE